MGLSMRASDVVQIDSETSLSIEIRQEKAEAYFAACKKMVASLDALKAFDQNIGARTLDSDQIAHRSGLLEEACERVFFVVIQREAMQLSGFEAFFENYEIPNEVRTGMGPKRRK